MLVQAILQMYFAPSNRSTNSIIYIKYLKHQLNIMLLCTVFGKDNSKFI